MRFTILDRKAIWNGKIFNIEQLLVRLPDARERKYDLIDHRDSVTILPVDNDRNVWFVRQFRMGCLSDLLELPAGVMDEGETPEECASREIREEIGFSANDLQKIGEIYLAAGYITEKNHIFLARQLSESPLQQDDDEFLETISISIQKAYAMARSGQISDSKTLAAFFLAQSVLCPDKP